MLRRALLLLLGRALGAHVFYSAIGGEDGPGVSYGDVSNTLVWGEWNEIGDVFASCEFFFENGEIGYMGGQRHADGSHSVIFSIWDHCQRYGSTTCEYPNATALPMGACVRFDGEGHGAHCDGAIAFAPYENYTFTVAVDDANATGRVARATVNGALIGEIFLRDTTDFKSGARLGGYGRLAPYARTFMEYWSGGAQAHSFGWVGPYAEKGTVGPPRAAVADAAEGLPVKVTSCIPGRACGRGAVFYNASVALNGSFPEVVDGGYWLDLWKEDERLAQRNMEACAWATDTGLTGNAAFFC